MTPARIKCLFLFCIAKAVVGNELREHHDRYQRIAPHLGAIICVFWSFVFGVLVLVELCSPKIDHHVNKEVGKRKEKKERSTMKPVLDTGKQQSDKPEVDEGEQQSSKPVVDDRKQADVEKGGCDEEEEVASQDEEEEAAKLTLGRCICGCMRFWAWILQMVGRDLRAITWLMFCMGFFVLAILSEMGVLGPLLSVLGTYCFIGILSIIVICWIGAVTYNMVIQATGGRLGTIEDAILRFAKAAESMHEMQNAATKHVEEMKNAANKHADEIKNAAEEMKNAANKHADEIKNVAEEWKNKVKNATAACAHGIEDVIQASPCFDPDLMVCSKVSDGSANAAKRICCF